MTSLTVRELEVLNLVKLGDENKQIGPKLGISEQTAKHHLMSIFKKLGAYNRTHAVYLCLRDGIIHFDRK